MLTFLFCSKIQVTCTAGRRIGWFNTNLFHCYALTWKSWRRLRTQELCGKVDDVHHVKSRCGETNDC